ncbi:MAG: hypothetical protein ACFB51_13020 [Anaerolineae bacterium]
MAAQTYRGTVVNGQIQWQDEPQLPDGAEVEMTVVDQPDNPAAIRGITGAEMLASGIVGLWADRDDIGDTVAFAEELRRKSEQRGGE